MRVQPFKERAENFDYRRNFSYEIANKVGISVSSAVRVWKEAGASFAGVLFQCHVSLTSQTISKVQLAAAPTRFLLFHIPVCPAVAD